MNRVMLDTTAGLPLSAPGREALLTALDVGWADPRRRYREARLAHQLLAAARESVAACLGVRPDGVSFTSSGTSAIRAGMAALAAGRARTGTGVLASAVEHSAVLACADQLTSADEPAGNPRIVGVDGQGRIDLGLLADALAAPGTALLAVQQVNPEVGTIQPLAGVRELAGRAGVPLFVDACAGVGRVGVPAAWDVLAASAHKWGGPAGVGVLARRPGVPWRPGPAWDGHDPAGFLAVPAIVAAAAALEAAMNGLGGQVAALSRLADELRRGLTGVAPDVVLLGPEDPAARAAHIVSATVLYADAETLVDELDRAGFAVGSGSACTSDTRRPSHVLTAMGAVTHGNLRISLAPTTTAAEVAGLLSALPGAIRQARLDTGLDWA